MLHYAVVKALRYHRFGPAAEVLRWEDAPDPRPRRGEIRVRVHAAGVNPKDVLTRKGKLGPLVRGFPQRSGQDLAGVVDAVGPRVKSLRVGEPVFGMIGGMGSGAVAELAVIRADHAALAPRSASMVEAAAVPAGRPRRSHVARSAAHRPPRRRAPRASRSTPAFPHRPTRA